MSRFGASRAGLKFRLAFSVAGLALMLVALFHRGVPTGPAFVEIVGMAGLFLGGTAIWTARQLARRREDA